MNYIIYSDATHCTYNTVILLKVESYLSYSSSILSRGPRITTTHKKLNKNLSHSYEDTNIGTNTIQELKHSLMVSSTVVVLGHTVASPRHRRQTWTLDFSAVLSRQGRQPSVAYVWGLFMSNEHTEAQGQTPAQMGCLKFWPAKRALSPSSSSILEERPFVKNGWTYRVRKSAILCL